MGLLDRLMTSSKEPQNIPQCWRHPPKNPYPKHKFFYSKLQGFKCLKAFEQVSSSIGCRVLAGLFCPERSNHTFWGIFSIFLKSAFLTHNYASGYARKPIKALQKRLKPSFQNNLSQKWLIPLALMARYNWLKWWKHAPIVTSPTENPKTRINFFFKSKLANLPNP